MLIGIRSPLLQATESAFAPICCEPVQVDIFSTPPSINDLVKLNYRSTDFAVTLLPQPELQSYGTVGDGIMLPNADDETHSGTLTAINGQLDNPGVNPAVNSSAELDSLKSYFAIFRMIYTLAGSGLNSGDELCVEYFRSAMPTFDNSQGASNWTIVGLPDLAKSTFVARLDKSYEPSDGAPPFKLKRLRMQIGTHEFGLGTHEIKLNEGDLTESDFKTIIVYQKPMPERLSDLLRLFGTKNPAHSINSPH